jgi:hypothetical protein
MVDRRFGLASFWWDLESHERLELSREDAREEEAGVETGATGRYWDELCLCVHDSKSNVHIVLAENKVEA